MSEGAAGPDLVLRFVNTHPDGGGRAEQLADGRAFARWLGDAGFAVDAATDADAAGARELRDALVTVLLAHSGDAPDDLADAERHLRTVAERYPLTPVVTAGGITLVSTQSGVPAALGSVLAAVATCDREGGWARLKACRNPPCHFGFVDRSRNGSAGFCSATCRSQASMRAYRARRRTAGD
jgi:predicted RNA-binding Zn ribbon-like protein